MIFYARNNIDVVWRYDARDIGNAKKATHAKQSISVCVYFVCRLQNIRFVYTNVGYFRLVVHCENYTHTEIVGTVAPVLAHHNPSYI